MWYFFSLARYNAHLDDCCHPFSSFCLPSSNTTAIKWIEGPTIASSTESTIEHISKLAPDDILIDVRHPADIDANPLSVPDNQLLCIPFFNLEKQLSNLNANKKYCLYCDKGIMSRLQAQLMREKGFNQVAVFRAKT